MGMDSETMSRVFEAYVQAPLDSTSSNGGIGLGLNICKQLVEMHGGTIEVRSGINIGSIFTFTLKLDADQAVRIRSTLIPEVPNTISGNGASPSLDTSSSYTELYSTSSTDRIQLMVVDDDPVNLNVLKSIFANEQYDLSLASNGKEALALLETGVWDLIISDVTMPIMSGYELTERIRKRFSIAELPVLLLTASNQEKDIESGFRSGANDYVTKPVNATELKSRVRSLTNLKKSVNEGLRMEAALLQAQIKPHFLINTFNAVSALSKVDRGGMDDLIDELTNYFRLSIDFQNSDHLVTLDRELSLIRYYLYIQQKRFRDRLQVVWEIDENIQTLIPPLSIQPLVDNAVIHGILKRSEGGEVRIKVAEIGQTVEISVSDNGMGIDEETLNHLLDVKSDRRTGIGLLNTDRRLKRFCGSTLRVHSLVESGTVVSFSVAKKS
jgi:sensor histidine kinase YesM